MASDSRAVWSKRSGRKTVYICGSWHYVWHQDRFYISLIQSEHSAGIRNHDFSVGGDEPEWGDWKIVEDRKKAAKIYSLMNPEK